MNKNLLKICFVIALSLSSTSVYAASTAITGSISMGGGSFSPSNKVTINVDASTSAYQAYSKHSNGDRVTAANSVEPKMFYKTVAITAGPDVPTVGTFTSTDWTSM